MPSRYLLEVKKVKVPQLMVKGQGWLTSARGESAEGPALRRPVAKPLTLQVALEILKYVAAVTVQLGFKFHFNISYFKVKN